MLIFVSPSTIMQLLWKSIGLLLFVFIPIQSQQISRWTCGQRLVDHNPFITNSSPTHHWPWHAAIFHRVYTPVPDYKCGGTVISSNYILTAGHCVSEYNAPMETKKVSVSLGRLNLSANESSAQNIEVISFFFSGNYTSYKVNGHNDQAGVCNHSSPELQYNRSAK